MKIMLHPLLPEQNARGYELRRRRHERALTSNDDKRNAILCADSYINIAIPGTNFSASPLSIV